MADVHFHKDKYKGPLYHLSLTIHDRFSLDHIQNHKTLILFPPKHFQFILSIL
jgi:hypothetical protein